MLSSSVSVPAAHAPRGSGRPLDSPPRGMRASHHLLQPADANAAPASCPLAQDRQGAPPTVPSSASSSGLNSSRQPTSRPLSLGIPHATPSSLQQHFRHQRHQSSTEARPAAVHSPASTIPSPTNEGTPRPRSIDMPFTGDARGARSPESGARALLNSWLPGPSSPSEEHGSSSTPSKSPRNTMAPLNTSTPSPSTSRFAFISSSISALAKSATSPTRKAKHDDELLNLNIQEALFPPSASPAGSRDAFSPAAFKNLEMTATALLTKFQNAYESQSTALRELEVERDTQAEEVEEADTRTKHLKLQLENMARQAAEREKEMRALMAALEREKAANRNGLASDSATITSEDLGVEDDQKRRTWRKSMAEDTDEESVGDAPSVFSRSRSPTLPNPPAGLDVQPNRVASSRSSMQSQPQISAFQKLMKGLGDAASGQGSGVCQNCQGQDERAAWDTASLLRDENRGLKIRVAELETCVDAALDAVHGIRL